MPDSLKTFPHLVPLADGWSLWRTICLRGPGFPIDLLENLVPSGLEVKIEHLLQCDKDYRRALDEALELSYRLKKVCAKEARTEWQRALKKLRKGRAQFEEARVKPQEDTSIHKIVFGQKG